MPDDHFFPLSLEPYSLPHAPNMLPPPPHYLNALFGQPSGGPGALQLQARRAQLFQIWGRLLADAQTYFDQLPARGAPSLEPFVPARAVPTAALPALAPVFPESPQAGLVLLQHARESWLSWTLLRQALPQLAQLGVKYVYLEALPHEMQSARQHGEISASAQEWINRHYPFADPQYAAHGLQNGLLPVLELARQQGIEILGLDTLPAYYLRAALRHFGVRFAPWLQRSVNLQTGLAPEAPLSPALQQLQRTTPWFAEHMLRLFLTGRVIQAYQQQSGEHRWVALFDLRRGGTLLGGGPRLADLLPCRSLRARASAFPDGGFLYPDHGVVEQRPLSAAGALTWEWCQADLLLDNVPQPSGPEWSAWLQPGQFVLRGRPDVEQLEIRVRGPGPDGRIRTALLQATDAGQLLLSRAAREQLGDDWQPMENRLVNSVAEFVMTAATLTGLQPYPSVSSDVRYNGEELRHYEHEYHRQREATLSYLVTLGRAEEQYAFRQGRLASASVLEQMHLPYADRGDLYQRFLDLPQPWAPPLEPAPFDAAQHNENLRQQGALMQAIDQWRARELTRLGAAWVKRMEQIFHRRGPTIEIQASSQNRFLAAAERQLGVCSALSAQFAAAWLMPQGHYNFSIGYYMRRLQQAIDHPGRVDSSLFGQGLLYWSYNAPEEKFAQHPARVGLDLNQVIQTLEQAQSTVAFECSLGSHALTLGVLHADEQHDYLLYDPNFGHAITHSFAYFQQALRFVAAYLWSHNLSIDGQAPAHPGFGLRQYRADLPAQPLFPATVSGAHTDSHLLLADLHQGGELGPRFNHGAPLSEDRYYQRLQQKLLIREYRARWVSNAQAELPLDPLLRALLAPYRNVEFPAEARLVELRCERDWAQIFYRAHPDDSNVLDLTLARAQDNGVVLQQLRAYKTFLQRVLPSRSYSARMARWLGRWQAPHFEIGIHHLTAALPDDGLLQASLLRALQPAAWQSPLR